jgi:hypothetical protein
VHPCPPCHRASSLCPYTPASLTRARPVTVTVASAVRHRHLLVIVPPPRSKQSVTVTVTVTVTSAFQHRPLLVIVPLLDPNNRRATIVRSSSHQPVACRAETPQPPKTTLQGQLAALDAVARGMASELEGAAPPPPPPGACPRAPMSVVPQARCSRARRNPKPQTMPPHRASSLLLTLLREAWRPSSRQPPGGQTTRWRARRGRRRATRPCWTSSRCVRVSV